MSRMPTRVRDRRMARILIDRRSLPSRAGHRARAAWSVGWRAGRAALRIAAFACALVSSSSLRLRLSLPVRTIVALRAMIHRKDGQLGRPAAARVKHERGSEIRATRVQFRLDGRLPQRRLRTIPPPRVARTGTCPDRCQRLNMLMPTGRHAPGPAAQSS